MNWINTKMKWIMLVSGVLTCTMIYVAIAPSAALLSMFGESLEGQLAEIVVRSWGVLIALMGAMLIYGAYNLSSRSLIMIVSGLSKTVFVLLVLVYGRQYLSQQAGLTILVDSIVVILFSIYLFDVWRSQRKG